MRENKTRISVEKPEKEKQKKERQLLPDYTPFQRFLVLSSLTLIALTVIFSAFYMLNKYAGIDLIPKKSDRPSREEQENTAQVDPVPAEDWDGATLRQTDDAGEKYVAETLFIGDSNFQRFVTQQVLQQSQVIGLTGKGIHETLTDKDVYLANSSSPVTAVDAVGEIKPRRILLNFGTNNLSSSADWFTGEYRSVIETMQGKYEYADIIVMSVPPLGKDISTSYGTLTMDDVNSFNEGLRAMCRDMGIPFLNVTDDVLKDKETGYARADIIYFDGIHLESDGLRELLTYYRTHAYETQDRRPGGTSGTYVVKPAQKLDCDSLSTDVALRLNSLGYTMAQGYDDPEGKVYDYSFSIPSGQTAQDQEEWAGKLVDFVNFGAIEKRSSIRITWSGNNDDGYVFYFKEFRPCETHTYGDWTVVTAATCSAEGSRKHTCSECGHEETEKTEKDPEAHDIRWETVTEATCSAAGSEHGICVLCGYETDREIQKKDHTAEVTQEAVPATCTEPGWTEEKKCSVCGELIQERTEVPALGHDYQWETIKEPTEDEDGERQGTCSRCGDVITEPIPATGGGDSGGDSDEGSD